VLDGRDIGTVIAPDAPAKLFVTASPQVRAERRWRQLRGQGEVVEYEVVLADIRLRDERDSGRAAAPLVRAPDAVLLDTTEMTIDEAADAARRIVEAARASWVSPN
jgi:cytidylate kinase